MDLTTYSETVRHQLVAAADAGGDDARALAERLVVPLDAAIRLALQEALTAAAEEITLELAPGSVELRLRGRELEFAVTPPPVDADDQPDGDPDQAPRSWPQADASDGEDSGMLRINLRMPDRLKSRVEQAAGSEGLSVNAWLVRAAASALGRAENGSRQERRAHRGAHRYTGWAR